ncbi:MAG: bifunctional phosphopantothenoylcysteine decarboxylase/phosphopantothenate--cysteine ligase CoaBC [Acidobacteria bacterium]|nr:bifunctional phosphopantothenoylcysteine decarboxylase/phosphopantothenate--cysteine ligase CoaBC [Acidobacteriota bacterium]
MALVALGVTGGIGAYKAVEVARGLQQRGHDIVAIMTRSARRFVGPVTFEAITRRSVITDQFARGLNANVEHIAIASDIALLLVAPATANIIGKFASGIADDFLSSLYLATRAPVLMAPAMNSNMLAHEAVRHNLEVLAARGVRFVEPGEGFLACGWIGRGRLAEPDDVVEAAHALLRSARTLAGRTVLVTAGPTYEDIDPVRYVGNRSSGRMGFAVAAEAMRRGASTILVTGPTAIDPPPGVEVVRVRSAVEMRDAVMTRASSADAIVMAAAVADYAPESGAQARKIEKQQDRLTLSLVRTPDILAELGRRRGGAATPVLVGFAAETGDLLTKARAKRRAKHVDVMVANDVSREDAGFDATTNAVTIIGPDGEQEVPLSSKTHVASVMLDQIESLLASKAHAAPA